MCLGAPAHTHGAEQALNSGLSAGPYTGAEQVMRIEDGREPDYRDNLNICHIEIMVGG